MTNTTQEMIERTNENTLKYLFENRREIERKYGTKNLAVLTNDKEVKIIDSDDDLIKLIEREQTERDLTGRAIITYTDIKKAVKHYETLRGQDKK